MANGDCQSDKSPFRKLFNQLKNLDCSSLNNLPDVIIDSDSRKDDRLEILDWSFGDTHSSDDVFNTLSPTSNWEVKGIPSLNNDILIFKNILKPEACTEWFNRLYHKWPVEEASVLKSHVPLPISEVDKKKLRWFTFGVHHNWDTKVYDTENRDPVPQLLDSIFSTISNITGLNVKPEAGIINFYSCRSRLSPHRDVSEYNLSIPLLSLSLGPPAIFMVGGEDEWDEPVVPILLREADLLVMKGSRRLSYHAVPKVFCNSSSSCDKRVTRVNINVRQVW